MRLRPTLGLVAAATALAVPAGADVSTLSDEFSDPASLSAWRSMQGEIRDGRTTRLAVADGLLTVDTAQSTWFRSQHAFFLWKEVTGDFVATTRLRVRGEHGPAPTANWSLAGLLVRAPTTDPNDENWLNFSIGRVGGLSQFERKTTTRSFSKLDLAAAPEGWVELRQVRIGPRFFLLDRPDGGKWSLFWRYRRGDLPRTLQVGLDSQTGTDDDHGDLVVDADYFRYASPGVPARLRARIIRGKAPLRRILPYLTKG